MKVGGGRAQQQGQGGGRGRREGPMSGEGEREERGSSSRARAGVAKRVD